MKSLFSEDYYMARWDEYLKPVPGEHYRNLEGSLQKALQSYKDAGLPEEAMTVLEAVEAKRIADDCHTLVMRELKTLKQLEAGTTSLGYTTQLQEIHARAELRKRFDFNCLQLREFKKAHHI